MIDFLTLTVQILILVQLYKLSKFFLVVDTENQIKEDMRPIDLSEINSSLADYKDKNNG